MLARIARGCLAGLIPLNSTVASRSLSTKTCPPAKVHFRCFLPSLFQEKTKLRAEGSRILAAFFARLRRAAVSAKLALSCSVNLLSVRRVSRWNPNYGCCAAHPPPPPTRPSGISYQWTLCVFSETTIKKKERRKKEKLTPRGYSFFFSCDKRICLVIDVKFVSRCSDPLQTGRQSLTAPFFFSLSLS